MTLTSPPVAVAPFESGRLAAGISASATTITVSPIFKTVNGVRTKQGFDTTSGIAIISQGDFTERISFEGSSVDATTKVTTLTTCVRGLSVTSTTASFSGGTGRIWPKGAKITLVADVSYFQSVPFKNVANTFSAKQTFAAGADFTSVTRPPKLPSLTQAEENALTPEEGMMWKNTTTGTNRQYSGGAISSIGTDATANASTTVAGKVEIATAAQRAASTATGETGALLVPSNDALVKTSSGAGDENKIPVLDSSGTLASGFIPNLLSTFGDGSDGDVTLGTDTTITRDMFYDDLNLSTFTLNTAGFRVYVKGTLSGTGKIKAQTGAVGSNGTNASGATQGTGGAAGAAAGSGSLRQTVAGVAGGDGAAGVSSNGNGTAGTAGTAGGAITNSIAATTGVAGGTAGAGGNGNGSNGGAAGAGGAAGTATAANRTTPTFYEIFATNAVGTWTPFNSVGKSGAGGGGGSGGRNASSGSSGGGGGGGGSGASGGFFYIAANTLTGSWTIESIGGAGGNGGNGGNSTADTDSGGGGGGGGGSGGPGGSGILVKRVSSGWSGSAVLTGGAAGTAGSGGAKVGAGVNGSAGSAGNIGSSGTLITITI